MSVSAPNEEHSQVALGNTVAHHHAYRVCHTPTCGTSPRLAPPAATISRMYDLEPQRVRHMAGVARTAASLAPEFGLSPTDMYVLGLLHDVGYAFSPADHAHAGGLALRAAGYRYWEQVYHHGDPSAPSDSRELALLNLADITTSPTGEPCTVDERLADIARRYGEESRQLVDARKVVDLLG